MEVPAFRTVDSRIFCTHIDSISNGFDTEINNL